MTDEQLMQLGAYLVLFGEYNVTPHEDIAKVYVHVRDRTFPEMDENEFDERVLVIVERLRKEGAK